MTPVQTDSEVAERLDPTPLQAYDWWELSCHLWRYEYAAAQRNLGCVADAACGLGYGTKILANAGHDVTGWDRDAEALATAQTRYPRLSFLCADLMTERFKGYTTLVSFETLEHLDNPWAFLKGLAPSVTTLLCSAPIVPTREHNPHHQHDFTLHGFGGLVEYADFRIVETHYQSAPTRQHVYAVIKAVR